MTWSDETRVFVGRVMAVVALVLGLLALVLYLGSGNADLLIHDWALHNIATVLAGAVAFVGLRKAPRSGAVWALAWVALFSGLQASAAAVSIAVSGISNGDIQAGTVTLSPTEIGPVSAIALNVALWAWVPALFILVTFCTLLFPDGNPPSPRWRLVGWVAAGGMLITAGSIAWMLRPWRTDAYADFFSADSGFGNVAGVGFSLILAASVASIAGLITRWRRAVDVERVQFKWIGWGLSTFAVAAVVGVTMDVEVWRIVSLALIPVLYLSYGVAITKYRLYDIDVIISRTLVYGVLAVFITSVYVGIVVGVGYLLGTQDELDPRLSIAAMVLIAISFQPLRRRMKRLANRIVYGRRATPHDVLSTFSQRVASVDPDVLSQIAMSLAEGTTAKAASLWMRHGDRLRCIAAWPDDVTPREIPATGTVPADVTETVVHDDEPLGLIALTLPTGQPLPQPDAQLLSQVAGGLGLALRNLLLTADLEKRVEQLRESRRRIVAVQDRTRRELERDLHDGAQQRLVAMKIKLGISISQAEKAGLDEVQAMLETVRDETDQTIETVRDFARGIYPPLLEAEGLGAALGAQVRKIPIPVTVHAAGVGRHTRELEATVYFCVLEALQNAVKHADAGSAIVSVDDRDGRLRFEVRDDGAGFDVSTTAPGTGLGNMADRLDAVGGSLDVLSTRGRGTVVSGEIPVTESVKA